MNRIVKVSGVEIVLNGHSVFQSTRENWYDFVPIPIFREVAAAIHVNFTNPFDFICDNINNLYKMGIFRGTTIETENSMKKVTSMQFSSIVMMVLTTKQEQQFVLITLRLLVNGLTNTMMNAMKLCRKKFGHEFVNEEGQ